MSEKVCDGCWKRGVCRKQVMIDDYRHVVECKCPCDGGRNWRHTDDPRRKHG